MTNQLIEGDPLEPSSTDIILQSVRLPIAETPDGEGWRVMTGNNSHSLWMRPAYRYEITGEVPEGYLKI